MPVQIFWGAQVIADVMVPQPMVALLFVGGDSAIAVRLDGHAHDNCNLLCRPLQKQCKMVVERLIGKPGCRVANAHGDKVPFSSVPSARPEILAD